MDHIEGAMLATDDGTSDMPDLLTSATYTMVQVNLVLQIIKKTMSIFLACQYNDSHNKQLYAQFNIFARK